MDRCIGNRIRQLRYPQDTFSDCFHKSGMLAEFMRRTTNGAYDSNGFVELLFDDSHRFRQITIIGNYYGTIVLIKPRIIQQMNGKIDVGTLFFRFYDPGKLERVGIGNRCADLVAEKVPVVNAYLGDICLQRSNVGLLADGLVWIQTTAYQGGIVFNGRDVVSRSQEMRYHGLQIEPFVRRTFHGPVIKVEAIDIDVCAARCHKKSRGRFRSPAPRVETTGEVVIIGKISLMNKGDS
jgi:hypothetical protein